MGYACPVCGTPQVDARHLANHVAFTAITGDDAHEEWLDEHVPEWGQLGEDALGERVVEFAERVDTSTDGIDVDGTIEHTHDAPAPDVDPRATGTPAVDDEAASILEAAREYTRQMATREEDDAGDGEGATGEETSAGDADDRADETE